MGDITLDSKYAVKIVRQAYNALTEEQKELVSNIEHLIDAENILIELEVEVVEKTKKIIKEAKTLEALEAIDIDSNLSEINKRILVKYKYARKKEIEEINEKSEKEVLMLVENLISNLPEEITMESKYAVERAIEAFDKLTYEQKGLIDSSKIAQLADALEKLGELENNNEKFKEGLLKELEILVDELKTLDLNTADFEKLNKDSTVKEINDAIDIINEILGDRQHKNQAIIVELDKYKKDIIKEIDNVTSIEDLERKIKSILIDSEIDFKIRKVVYEGNTEYEIILSKLSLDRKIILTKELPKTEDERIAREVEEKIAKLPEEITLEANNNIELARTDYEKLTDKQKKLINNLKVLEEAENKLMELKKDLEHVNKSIEEIKQKLKSNKVYRNKYRVEQALKGINLNSDIEVDANGIIFVKRGNIKKSIEVKIAEKEKKEEVIKNVKETGKKARLKVLKEGSLSPYFNVVEVTDQVTLISIADGKDNTSLGFFGEERLPISGTLGVVAIKDMADLETVDTLIVNGKEFSLVEKEDKTHKDIQFDGIGLISSAKPSGVSKLGETVGQEISIILKGYEFGEIKHTIKIVERKSI